MKDPRRLLQEGDEAQCALLRSAEHDNPPEGAELAVLVALGLAAKGAGAVAVAGSAAASAAGSGSGAAGVAGAAAKLTAWSMLKWVGIGMLAGGAALGGARALGPVPPGAPAQTAFAPAVSHSPPALVHAAPAALHDAAAEPPGLDDAAPPRREWVATMPAQSASAASAGAELSLAEEVAALDRARKALESGDPASALRAIEQRERQPRAGVLQPEAMVVRIEAHLKMGRRQVARELASQFLADYPGHPLRNRVQALLVQADAATPSGGATP
jgi:hypothetical protein